MSARRRTALGEKSEEEAVGARAVFLDRDGVLNRAPVVDGIPRPPSSVAELELEPGVEEACRRLREAGLLLIVVSNQPDVARGSLTIEAVTAVNEALRRRLPIDDVRICPHDDSDGCACRKPRPGMLLDAAAEWGVDLRRSFMVGDRRRDIEAGRRAGCRTVFVDHGYAEAPPHEQDLSVAGLDDALPWLLDQSARSSA